MKVSLVPLVSILVAASLTGCAGRVRTAETPKKHVLFTGAVVSTAGKPVNDALIDVNGALGRTDGKGGFGLLVHEARRYVINIRKPGFALVSSISTTPVRDRTWSMTPATMQVVSPAQSIFVRDSQGCQGPLSSRVNWASYPLERQPRTLDANGRLAVGQYAPDLKAVVDAIETPPACSQGVSISIPANSLVDAAGNPARGNVEVSVATVDLLARDAMPGDFTVDDGSGRPTYMRSAGAGMVEVQAGGRPYQLRKGARATLTIPLHPLQTGPLGKRLLKDGKVPAEIPLLLYDERVGVWQPRAVARLSASGDAYVAEIDHLSAFNMDILKSNPSCLKFTSAGIVPPFTLEIALPSAMGEIVRTKEVDAAAGTEHALYNLPNDTNIELRVFKDAATTPRPLGTYLANTGPAHAGASPPPAPYTVCNGTPVWTLTEIILEVAAFTANSVSLRWTAVPGVFEYQVAWNRIGGLGSSFTTTSTTATVSFLMASTAYRFQVTALLAAAPGNQVFSNEVTQTTAPVAATPPPTPTGVVAVATSSASTRLTWNDVTGETSYRVRRGSSASGPFSPIGAEALPPNTPLQFDDTGLASRQTYYYSLEAVNAAGASSPAVVSATTGYNLVGQWLGTGTETWTGCADPNDNVTTGIAATVNITGQVPEPSAVRDTVSGTGTFTAPAFPGPRSDVSSLNASLSPTGQLTAGGFATTDYDAGGSQVSTGRGTFSGSVTGGGTGLAVSFSGFDLTGDTCQWNGSLTLTRQ